MFGLSFSKLLLLAVVAAVVWFAYRFFKKRGKEEEVRRLTQAPAQATVMTTGEDLAACRICGVFVSSAARACGRAGCPYPSPSRTGTA